MKHKDYSKLEERPAFISIIDYDTTTIINGYTLMLDVDSLTLSIINFKKGGSKNMIKTILKAKKGWEELYDKVMAKKENHEASKNEAIEDIKNTLDLLAEKYEIAIDVNDILAKVEEKFVTDAREIEKVLEQVSVVEEIEIPDETEEIVTSEEVTPIEVNQNI